MITLTYKEKSMVVNSDEIEYAKLISEFNQSTNIELQEESTFNELKTINENLFYYQTSPLDNLSQYYFVKSIYDPEYVEIIKKCSSEIYPEYNFTFEESDFFKQFNFENSCLRYSFHNFNSILNSLEIFSDNLVLAGTSVLDFIFGINEYNSHLYIHSTDLNSFLIKIRKHLTEPFLEDSETIIIANVIIYKKLFNSKEEIANSFEIETEQCIMDLKTKIVYRTELCKYSHSHKVITFNFDNMSQYYYYKIGFYISKGFYVYIPGLNGQKHLLPSDLTKFQAKYQIEFNHRGVLLLTRLIFNFNYFDEKKLIKNKITFNKREEFFYVDFNEKRESNLIPLQEFLENNNLKYWYPENKIDLKEFIIQDKITSHEKPFLNFLFGFNIYPQIMIKINSKNGERIYIDIIENLLCENGYDINELQEFSRKFSSIEDYFENFKNTFAPNLSQIDYIRRALLVIYDYNDFESRYISEEVEELKQMYNNYIKKRDIFNEIIKNINCIQTFYRIYVNENSYEIDKNPFYQIIDRKIFIYANVLDLLDNVSQRAIRNFSNFRNVNHNYLNYLSSNNSESFILEFKSLSFSYDDRDISTNIDLIDRIFSKLGVGFETPEFLKNHTNLCNVHKLNLEDVVEIKVENGVTFVKF